MVSDGDRAIALLRYANYQKVGRALHVSRSAVADWAKGKSVTPYRLRQLEQLLRPDLQTAKEPPPEWARAAEDRIVSEVRRNREVLMEALAAGFAEQAARELDEDNDDAEPDGKPDQPPGGAGPRPTPAS